MSGAHGEHSRSTSTADRGARSPRRALGAQLDLRGILEAAQPALRDEAVVDRALRPSKVVHTGVPSATASRFMVPPALMTTSA